MSRKDYELIASILLELGDAGALCFDDPSDRVAIALAFAKKLKRANSRFDTRRFIEASIGTEDLEAWEEDE